MRGSMGAYRYSAELPPEERGWRGILRPFESSQYRWLFASNMAFFFAMNAQSTVVRPWITYQLTNSKVALGAIMLTVAVPMVFISPFGGVLADRWERRNLVLLGQAVIVLSELSILGLLALDALRFWHLLVGSALMGAVFPFVMPARQALVVNIVGKAGLSRAMALSMAGMNVTRVLGPALSGFLIDPIGIVWTYAVGTALYGVGVLTLLGVHRSRPPAHVREVSVLHSLGDGLRYLAGARTVTVLLFFGLVPMFLAMPFGSLLVVFAEDVWHVGARGLGVLTLIGGVGGVLGSVWVAQLGDSPRRLRRQMSSLISFCLAVAGFALSPWFYMALPLVLAANAFSSLFGTLNNTAIQLLIPDEVRGRVSSFLMMSFSLPLLGTFPLTVVAEFLGAPAAVTLAASGALVAALVFFALSPALRDMDAAVHKGMQDV